jgi:serine protease AprX
MLNSKGNLRISLSCGVIDLKWSAVVLILCCVVPLLALMSVPSRLYAQEKYWVFFKDKPNAHQISLSKAESKELYLVRNGFLTKRAIVRRSKFLPPSTIVSEADFPVYAPYLDSLKSLGLMVTGTSRWFNAAAVVADSSQLMEAKRFPFVVGLKKIVTYTSSIEPVSNRTQLPVKDHKEVSSQPGDSSFYGPSYAQFELSGIPEVHALGINGDGVLIGMLDSGFRYETHDALKNIKIVGEHDFIQGDSVTANQSGDSFDQDSHGTMTLSLLGAYAPGNLVGVAYGAGFLLAKTELIYPDKADVDYKSEEDYWIEGLEWMESRGVDVVSSSLGYNVFVDSLTGKIDSAESYFWSRGDYNGKTALASRAATRAADLGVVVVDAMGNEGNGNGTIGTMDVPADADSIISVGAVGTDSVLASFSSTGPTNDGRIKPDLVADGVDDYVADVPGPDTYTNGYMGTSFSTPIVAGVAGLVISVRPDLKPSQVIRLLESTAVKFSDPDFPERTLNYPNNYYGWGIVNAWNAIMKLAGEFAFWRADSSYYFAIRVFSRPGVDPQKSAAYYSIDGRNYVKTNVFTTDTVGQYCFKIPVPITLTDNVSFYFDLVDSNSKRIGWPYHDSKSPFRISGAQLNVDEFAGDFLLFNNYPNPFNLVTHIGLVLKNSSCVVIDIYDVLGRKVKQIFSGQLPSGFQTFAWDGSSESSKRVASGVYFIRVDVAGSAKILKTLYLR